MQYLQVWYVLHFASFLVIGYTRCNTFHFTLEGIAQYASDHWIPESVTDTISQWTFVWLLFSILWSTYLIVASELYLGWNSTFSEVLLLFYLMTIQQLSMPCSCRWQRSLQKLKEDLWLSHIALTWWSIIFSSDCFNRHTYMATQFHIPYFIIYPVPLKCQRYFRRLCITIALATVLLWHPRNYQHST